MSGTLIPVEPAEIGRNYFTRHWYGELGLGKSWFLSGFLANIPDAILKAMNGPTENFTVMLPRTAVIAILLWGLSVVSYVWLVCGIWRSAGRSVERHHRAGTRAGWARTAQVITIISVVIFALQMVTSAEQLWGAH